MLRKRTCQADLFRSMHDAYPEPMALSSAYTKLVRHWDAFDRYLETCPQLEPVPAPDEETVLQEHLQRVGESTHEYALRDVMQFTGPVTARIIDELVTRGCISREVTRQGAVLHRIG